MMRSILCVYSKVPVQWKEATCKPNEIQPQNHGCTRVCGDAYFDKWRATWNRHERVNKGTPAR